MTNQLDALVASLDLPEGCDPDDPRFRRELLIELRKDVIVRRGVALRLRAGKRGQP